MARVDRIDHRPLRPATRRALLAQLAPLLRAADGVLLSDYRVGVVHQGLVSAILATAKAGAGFVAVDSQGEFKKFRGVYLLRCNREEAEGYLRRSLRGDTAFVQAGLALRRRLGVAAVAITRGSEGMTVVDAAGIGSHIPASNPSEVYDVTGAGDTVIAMLTLALSAGAPVLAAAQIANYAAGQVVRKLGNATVSRQELEEAVMSSEVSP